MLRIQIFGYGGPNLICFPVSHVFFLHWRVPKSIAKQDGSWLDFPPLNTPLPSIARASRLLPFSGCWMNKYIQPYGKVTANLDDLILCSIKDVCKMAEVTCVCMCLGGSIQGKIWNVLDYVGYFENRKLFSEDYFSLH